MTQAGIEDVHEYGDYTLLNSGKLEDELFWFLHTVAKLRIPSTFGFLSEAQDYDETFLQDGGPIRGAEGSKIDGALYIGDADLSSVTYADKLDNFLALGGTNKPDFAGEDSKAPGRQLMWNGRSVPSLGVTIGAQTQERHAAHFCVHFDGAPHMRVLLPATKEALFEWRFGSFLSYHMPVRLFRHMRNPSLTRLAPYRSRLAYRSWHFQ